ncbi:MAG TPA: hypothetical protein VJM31_15340 [Vicinamibacterales bacterium]|nr:hypothetical protein [Vicinamibacterales bacterium]
MRNPIVGVLAWALLSTSATAQTTDGGCERALSTSLARIANTMHSTIRVAFLPIPV